jgi:gliding motility-associated-like protein
LSTRVGTYKLSYTTNNEGLICKDSIYITINDLAKPDLGEDDFICFGGYMNIEGGDYSSFDWLPNGEKSREMYISTGGEYIVNVVDFNGCPGSDTININVKDLPKPDVLFDISFCGQLKNGYELDVSSFDNGDGPYTYNWINNTNGSSMRTRPSHTQSFPGYYWVDITDKYGCTGRDSVLLSIDVDLTPVIIGSPLIEICEGDSVTLVSNYKSSGVYNFNWSTGESTESIVVKESGDYVLNVTSRHRCKGTATVKVIVNPIPVVSDSSYNICIGDKIKIGNDLGGEINNNYLWEDSVDDTYYLEVDKAGDYKRTVTTDKGCLDSSVYSLVVNDLPIIDLGNDTSICQGDSVLINAGGNGLSYNWNSGDTTSKITAYTDMKYILEVTNIYGCENIDSVLITVDTLPVLDLGPDTSICSYQTIELDAGNILSNHLWSNGSVDNIITVSDSGDYSVVVTNSFNCSVSDTITLDINNPPIVNLGNDTSICVDSVITFDALVGVSWKWDNNNLSRTLTTNESGDFDVVVTDINGCVGYDTISLVINELPIVDLGPDTSICVDSVITFDALVGVSWKWDNNNLSRTLTTNESGDYDVIVTDINGCVGYDTISLVVNELPIINLGNDTSICVDSLIIFDALVGVDWLWSTGDLTKIINVNESGDYDVIVTDINGCVGYDTISLSINQLPVVDLGDDVLVCDETPVNLTSNSINGYSYKWNSGEITNSISPIVGGDYELSVTDINNCVGYDEVYVEFVSNPLLDLGDDITICQGDVAILESNSQFTTTWSTGSVGDTIMVNQSGSFISTISNGVCSDTDTVNVKVIGIPISDLDKSIENELICFDDYQNGINLNAGGNDRNDYLWNTGETTVDINVYKGGSYDVIISDEICSISDTVVIKAYCPPSLYIPNAFTPNGDDMNNTFFAKSRNIVGFNILIFDRWGMLIFESDNVFQHWDGTFKGRPVQQDVYVWKICYSYYNIEGPLVEKNRIGTVTVIR